GLIKQQDSPRQRPVEENFLGELPEGGIASLRALGRWKRICRGQRRPRRKEDSARLADAPEQRIKGVHRQRVEQPVGLGERRPADDGGCTLVEDDLAREARDSRGLHARESFDGLGRVVRQAPRPPFYKRAGSSRRLGLPQTLVQDHVSQAQHQRAFGAGPGGDPLVGARSGQRHSRFHLDELAADSGASLPHLAVPYGLGYWRIPGTEEIGAERNQVVRGREVERGQLRVAEAQEVCPPQYRFVEKLKTDGRRCAVGFQETLDQFAALSAQGTSQKNE